MIEVVAGIIFNDSRSKILLSLRKPEQHQGDRWEFPGGKLEAGENPRAGLLRELQEELGIIVNVCAPRSIVEHRYPDKLVRLHFWDVTDFAGEPTGHEGQEVQWVSVQEAGTLQFPDANQAIVKELIAAAESGAESGVASGVFMR